MKSLLLSISFSLAAFQSFAFGLDPMHPRITPLQPRLNFGWHADGSSEDDETGKALSFGYYEFRSELLNAYLINNGSPGTGFADNYMAIGIDDIANADGHWFDVIGSIQYILPQTGTCGPNDSLKLKLHGWHYTMSLLSYDFFPGRTVAFVIATQISMGNLKMKREVGGVDTRYTNPFIAPGGRAEFRLTLGQFIIGARATYRYDITHELWKRKDDMMPVLPEYSNDGLAYFGYIGWFFEGKGLIDRPNGGGDIGGRHNGGEWR